MKIEFQQPYPRREDWRVTLGGRTVGDRHIHCIILSGIEFQIPLAMKAQMKDRLTTVFPRQGHYALDRHNDEVYPPALARGRAAGERFDDRLDRTQFDLGLGRARIGGGQSQRPGDGREKAPAGGHFGSACLPRHADTMPAPVKKMAVRLSGNKGSLNSRCVEWIDSSNRANAPGHLSMIGAANQNGGRITPSNTLAPGELPELIFT